MFRHENRVAEEKANIQLSKVNTVKQFSLCISNHMQEKGPSICLAQDWLIDVNKALFLRSK